MPSRIRRRGHHPPRNQFADPLRPSNTRLTYKERSQMFSLYRFSHWSYLSIAAFLRRSYATVYSTIQSCIEAPKKPQGRPPMLNTRLRKRLNKRATANACHRRLSYEEIAQLEGIRACRRTLTAAFEKEQYHRRVAVEKPL